MKSTSNFVAIVLLLTATLASSQISNVGWWKHAVFYQIYPRSFMDFNNDGVGDMKGITSKLQHFSDSGIQAIWLSPIYQSPMVDFGYDISDFKKIDPQFGTLQDFKELTDAAKKLGLKVILDLVPNHTSDKHEWFEMSVNRTGDYTDYYIWSDGKKNETGHMVPPNNWASVFNGSAWTYHPTRKQFYFHQFYPQQPDLNYNNPAVQAAMKDVMKFWLDQGADGFRIDAVPHLFEGDITQNEPILIVPGAKPTDHVSFNHTLTKDHPKTYELVQSWRNFVDEYAKNQKTDEKVLLTEAYTTWDYTIKYYKYGSSVPFNFKFITDANATSAPSQFKKIIDDWMRLKPTGTVANWVMGNHDRTRIGTRYPNREDQLVMLEMILPGIAVTYYGEEIGMVDNETLHQFDFRDGARTPFQWDSTVNAGFNKGNKTWLPVHSNYKELNLEKQKAANNSHYKLYTTLTKMRSESILREGSLTTAVLNNDVLAVVRYNKTQSVSLLLNFSPNKTVSVDLTKVVSQSGGAVILSSVNSVVKAGTDVTLSQISIPPNAAILVRSSASIITISSFLIAPLLVLLSLLRL